MDEKAILILVVGPTGAGKTTFVNQVTGSMYPVSRGPNLCTGSIYSVACRSLGKKVTVIDTPGFGTCCKSDTELLEYIARFLGGLHKERKLLTGIVLLQPVYTDRIWEHEAKLVHLIKSICGPQAYRNIIIATSTPYSHPDGQTAQDQIRSREQNLWRDMINGGAEIWEYNNSRQSAENIVEELVDDRRAVLLQLQHELEMSEGRLLGTTAAREAHHVSLALYLSEQQRLYAEICHLRHQLSTAPHDRVYLQRRCADLEYERSSKTFQEQEVQRKKLYWSDDVRKWAKKVATASGTAAATELGKDFVKDIVKDISDDVCVCQ